MAETSSTPFALKTRDTAVMAPEKKASAINVMAQRYSVEPDKLFATLKATVFKGATNEELLALVVVANEYELNPFLKQIYAFPAKGGGIVPVVSIDGWLKIVNQQPDLDGLELEWEWDEKKKPIACTAIIWIKGRSKPVRIPEYFEECFRNTDPWNKMPRRMLRHKAIMQCARVAFGLGGLMDEDEATDIAKVPRATRATFDVPVDVSEQPKQIANAKPANDDDGDLGPVATETASTLPPETTDVPADPNMPQDQVNKEADKKARAQKAPKAPKEPEPVSPVNTLKALIAAGGFNEAEAIEAAVKTLGAPGAKSVSEWPVEFTTDMVNRWRELNQEIRNLRITKD